MDFHEAVVVDAIQRMFPSVQILRHSSRSVRVAPLLGISQEHNDCIVWCFEHGFRMHCLPYHSTATGPEWEWGSEHECSGMLCEAVSEALVRIAREGVLW